MKSGKNIDFFKNIRQVREFDFGLFYYFDGLVISEMKEGVIFRWNMSKKAVQGAHEVLGKDVPIAYISNRINNYFVVPTDWVKFYRNRHQLHVYSVVGATKGSFASIVFERMFFRKSIRKFTDLTSAIEWSIAKIAAEKELV